MSKGIQIDNTGVKIKNTGVLIVDVGDPCCCTVCYEHWTYTYTCASATMGYAWEVLCGLPPGKVAGVMTQLTDGATQCTWEYFRATVTPCPGGVGDCSGVTESARPADPVDCSCMTHPCGDCVGHLMSISGSASFSIGVAMYHGPDTFTAGPAANTVGNWHFQIFALDGSGCYWEISVFCVPWPGSGVQIVADYIDPDFLGDPVLYTSYSFDGCLISNNIVCHEDGTLSGSSRIPLSLGACIDLVVS